MLHMGGILQCIQLNTTMSLCITSVLNGAHNEPKCEYTARFYWCTKYECKVAIGLFGGVMCSWHLYFTHHQLCDMKIVLAGKVLNFATFAGLAIWCMLKVIMSHYDPPPLHVHSMQ